MWCSYPPAQMRRRQRRRRQERWGGAGWGPLVRNSGERRRSFGHRRRAEDVAPTGAPSDCGRWDARPTSMTLWLGGPVGVAHLARGRPPSLGGTSAGPLPRVPAVGSATHAPPIDDPAARPTARGQWLGRGSGAAVHDRPEPRCPIPRLALSADHPLAQNTCNPKEFGESGDPSQPGGDAPLATTIRDRRASPIRRARTVNGSRFGHKSELMENILHTWVDSKPVTASLP